MMPRFFNYSLLLLLFQLSFSQSVKIDFVISNVSIIPMTSEVVLKNKDIAIKNGKVVAIVDSKSFVFDSEHKIDGKGKFLIPSLSDAHVHLPEKEGDLSEMFSLYLINGVTKIRSMRGETVHPEWKKKYNSADSFFPKMYLSSIPIRKSDDFTDEKLTDYVKNAKNSGFDFIKLLSIKNEDLFSKLDELCKENDIRIAGHFPSNPSGTVVKEDIIFDSNLNSIEHLGGLIGEKDLFESRIKAIKEKNIFVCPTLDWYIMAYGLFNLEEVKNKGGMEFVNQDVLNEWIYKTSQYREKLGKDIFDKKSQLYAKEIEERLSVINRLNREHIKLLLSPDSSSNFGIPGFGILEEMKLYKKAGLSNYDILKTATVNFAEYFNETSYGTIEVGKNADFLLLSENPLKRLEALQNIEGLYFNNNFLDKKKLNELANSIISNDK